MAATIEATYSKKLGLPGYSSHQFSITVTVELTDLSQVEKESTRLYGILQTAVDREIRNPGFVPGDNDSSNGRSSGGADEWRCSAKQRDFFLVFIDEHHLDKIEVDRLARQLVDKSVRELNKMEMSGLLGELLEQHGGHSNGNGQKTNGYHQVHQRGSAR